MPKEALRQEIQDILNQADNGMAFAPLLDAVTGALSRHPDALAGLTSRYRIQITDANEHRAFALEGGTYRPLADSDLVDVTVQGREEALLRVFRRQLSPMSALLTGKIKVKGDKAALLRFAEFL